VFQVPWNRHFIAFSGCRKLSLHSRRTGVIHVVTAVMTAPGEYKMTTSTAKQTETAQAIGKIVEPKATKKPRVPARGAHVASAKGKSGKKATPPKKAAKAPKTAKAAPAAPKEYRRLTSNEVGRPKSSRPAPGDPGREHLARWAQLKSGPQRTLKAPPSIPLPMGSVRAPAVACACSSQTYPTNIRLYSSSIHRCLFPGISPEARDSTSTC
jgi:hypothetical protein